MAVTISDAQLEEVLWDREAEERGDKEIIVDTEDIYAFGDETLSRKTDNDWIGVQRDRRSAYLIMGALKSEGIL